MLLADYAHGFMSIKLVGNINIGLVLGLQCTVHPFVGNPVYREVADRPGVLAQSNALELMRRAGLL